MQEPKAARRRFGQKAELLNTIVKQSRLRGLGLTAEGDRPGGPPVRDLQVEAWTQRQFCSIIEQIN